jgi:hypothetical protein
MVVGVSDMIAPSIKDLNQDLHAAAHKGSFACGSMVLPILSVFCFLRSTSAKTKHKRR